MHTKHHHAVDIHHDLADIAVLRSDINTNIIKHLIYSVLEDYTANAGIPAEVLHREIRERYGDYYRTPGYYLKIFRFRADLTQVQLAKQINIPLRHLSEMEHNKRPIGKNLAKQLAKILNIDYRKLL